MAGGETHLLRVGEDATVSAVWPDETDDLFVWRDGYLVPTALRLCSATDVLAPSVPLKAERRRFVIISGARRRRTPEGLAPT